MKILLVNPSRIYMLGLGSKGPRIGLPLGIMYVAAALEQAGHKVKIFDFLISKNTVLQKVDDLVIRHGDKDKNFINFLRREKPGIVGISSPFTVQIPETVRISQLVKSVYPSILIMVGGPHFSVAGLDFLKDNPQIDIAVSGEGEITAREVLHSLEKGFDLKNVPGIIFRNKDNQIITTKTRNPISSNQLNSLPLPAYHLIDMPVYFSLLEQGFAARVRKDSRSASIITSRGCPYNCVFCSIHLHMGRLWRCYSSKSVLNHIDFLVKNYQIKHISFEDDNLIMNRQRFDRILDGLIKKNYGITWDAPNGVRAESLNDENFVKKMKKSGCVELIMGAESGVQEVLDKIIKKNLQLSHVINGAKVCKKVGIPLKAFFVIGFPGESKKNMKETVKFSLMLRRKYKVKSGVMFATPLLGTRLYKICRENNFFAEEPTPESLAVATQSRGRGLIKTNDFTPDDLKKMADLLERGLFKIKLCELMISPSKLVAVIRRRLERFKQSKKRL